MEANSYTHQYFCEFRLFLFVIVGWVRGLLFAPWWVIGLRPHSRARVLATPSHCSLSVRLYLFSWGSALCLVFWPMERLTDVTQAETWNALVNFHLCCFFCFYLCHRPRKKWEPHGARQPLLRPTYISQQINELIKCCRMPLRFCGGLKWSNT